MKTGRPIGRPKVVSKKLTVGLYDVHREYIERESRRTGRHEGDIVRDALDQLINQPAEPRRRSR